jgi:hypothetical protein
MPSSTGRFSALAGIFTSVDLTFRAAWCVHILSPNNNCNRWSSTDEVGQVNLPYITWVAAYNTTVLLCYILLDLVFFPTPLSKSTYSPVSGLKVVRRPNNDDDKDLDPTSTSPSTPLDRVHATGLSLRMTTAAMVGPSPMPEPPLLEAINRNSLAVFLLVCIPPFHLEGVC